ncbi:polyphenol oxidase family protein [Nocardioides gilvus]|uniref:polyphenol oxidase family protein n=1 Tax=Nocardioides gilvus TaxID=1735589 RepID=UPI000D745E51|nr:polyphenol oxidase family protein [Nocardioides gilvus]
MFAVRRRSAGGPDRFTVEIAFTDASVDVSEGAGRDPSRLAAELSRLSAAIGVPLARMSQVHGDVVAEGSTDSVPEADVLVTDSQGLALMTRAADCVPVVLADDRAGIVAAVHAGRAGVALGVVPRAVEAMQERGAAAIHAWIGPHVCGGCYEVPLDMRAEVARAVPASWSETSWGTPSLDLGRGVESQLEALGVVHERVGSCTVEDDSLWSHRRGGAPAGRLAGLVWMAS